MSVEQGIVQMSFLCYPFYHLHLHNTDIQVWSVLCNTFSRNHIPFLPVSDYSYLVFLVTPAMVLQDLVSQVCSLYPTWSVTSNSVLFGSTGMN